MTEMNSVVLEIDPVFMYQVEDKLKSCLKASEWNISNPVWHGKLQIAKVSSNRHQVQFVNSNGIFGVVAIKDHVGSPMFQKVLDSNRYFTTKIKNTISGKNDVIGIGFINRSDGSKLLKALDQCFTSKDDSKTIDAPRKCNKKDQIKVEIKIEVPENNQVEINTPQESQSDNGTHTRCHRDGWIRTEPTTDILAHTRTGQEKRTGTSHDEHIVQDQILTSGGEYKYKLPESESTIANNSKGETPCIIAKKRKIEPQSQDLMHLDAQPEQEGSQQSVNCFRAVQQPSRKCVPSFLPSELLLNNKNGIICLDPVTLELICPFCGFNTHDKYDMKLLLSHWQKDGGIKETSTCSLCYIIFSTPKQRLKHVNVHTCNGQVKSDTTSVDEHNVEEGILSNGDEDKFEKEEGEITSDDNSEEEAPCPISDKEKIEIRPRDRIKHEIELLHIYSPSEKNCGQETSGPCVPSFLPTKGLSNNENGAFCLDPVTLELICPLCSFQTDSKYDMKLLLSHWRKDHAMTRHDTCRLCFILFSTPEQRLSHLKVHRFVCAICLHEVKMKKEFLDHIKKWHVKRDSQWMSPNIDDNNHLCNRCSKEFENTNDLIDHFKLNNSATQCSTARTTVQEHETGSTYSLEIDRKKRFICHLCPISKFRSLKLKVLLCHWEKEHNLRQPITCNLCHLVFFTEEQRLYHVIALHTVCSVCSVEFGTPDSIDRHMMYVHRGIRETEKKRKKKKIEKPYQFDLKPTAWQTYTRGDEDKYEAMAAEEEITFDDNSEEEAPCKKIAKNEEIESQSQDQNKVEILPILPLHINSEPEETVGQESVDGFDAVQTPSGQCVPSDLPSMGLPGNDNGKCFMDPVTLKLICPLCSLNTHSNSIHVLSSHLLRDHYMNKAIICSLCSIYFVNQAQRLSHINAHHLSCSICSSEFTDHKHLRSHLEIWHKKLRFRMSSNSDKHYRCNRCSKEFENINDMINHFGSTGLETERTDL